MNSKNFQSKMHQEGTPEWMARLYRPEDVDDQKARFGELARRFSAWTGGNDIHLVRAPGRVNLIGEHTDYNHCPVFPMAVDRDIIGAFIPRKDGKIVIADFNPDFGERDFEISPQIPPHNGGDWANYIKAAVQGLIDENIVLPEGASGFQLMFHSSIPPAAGMSSSSALVVLAALVFLNVNGRTMDKKDLADLLARAERYTGTQGGGMDQAAILLGESGKALKIDFAPLRTVSSRLPDEYGVLVAHSTVDAPKTREVMDKYNRRSIECRLATSVLSRLLEKEGHPPVGYLGELPGQWREEEESVRTLLKKYLKEEGYTKEELCSLLNINEEELNGRWCSRKDGSVFPEPSDGFLLFRRAFHVLSEWNRVETSAEALAAGEITAFGDLMNRSHDSCRDNHEISCPELDRLVKTGQESGAEGCRLTGAGFGGCTVHLVRLDRMSGYRTLLEKKYYKEYLGVEDSGSRLFVVKPSEGATVLKEENL